MLQIRFISLRQWSGPFVEIWIGDYFLAEGRLDSFAVLEWYIRESRLDPSS
jgi:hypothetical protein